MQLDRYNRPYLLPTHLHCSGMPFEIEAGALLVDTMTNDVLVQLKLVSHSDMRVKAVKVVLQPEDTRGVALGDKVTHQYLDLDVGRGESFGQKTPIPLPNQTTRSFSICDVEVVYSDNTTSSSNGGSWKQLPDQTPLRATTADEELIRQYQIEYGDSCVYHLQELPGLWRCVCGAMNRSDEVTCHACGQRLDTLRAIDSDTLERHKEARLETERIEREAQAERERLAKEEEARIASEKKERLKKNGIRAAVVAAVAVVAYLIASVTIIPASKYSSAVGMMEAGNYADAEAAFADLGDYKDASDKVTECQYGRATGLMESGDLESARAVFTSLGEYKDSQTKVEECNDGLRESAKTKAAELILQGKYDDAIAACRDSKVTNTTEENRALFAEAERLAIKNAEIGDKVTYGQYSNKSLALWRVIDKKKDRALLLCDVCLFRSALGEFRSEITWEDVEFRKVMNSDETLSGIFNNYELPNILSQKHVYDGELDEKTGKYKAGTEKKCTDRLFCPNASDILQAFPNARERISTYNGQALFWWLSDVEPRGSEGYTYFRAISWEDGSLSDWYASGDLGIRPAMWVSFE